MLGIGLHHLGLWTRLHLVLVVRWIALRILTHSSCIWVLSLIVIVVILIRLLLRHGLLVLAMSVGLSEIDIAVDHLRLLHLRCVVWLLTWVVQELALGVAHLVLVALPVLAVLHWFLTGSTTITRLVRAVLVTTLFRHLILIELHLIEVQL